jgi:hypothetical protein
MDEDELNPLTLGEMPENMVENEDGSVDVLLGEEAEELEETPFQQNLAEVWDEDTLSVIGGDLVELVEKDQKSREKRDEQYQEGIRRSGLGDDAPGGADFAGANKVVHPVLAEACVDFASRAIKELFPATGPVKPWVAGETTPDKMEKAQRKTRYMNWQLTTRIKEYREELEQLLTQVPMGGSQYMKVWRDDRLRRARVEFVPVDDIFLPYAATSFYTAQRATHRQLITRDEYNRRVASGLYRDVSDPIVSSSIPDQSASGEANDKIEGREEDGFNEDGLREIYEIYTYLEEGQDSVSGGDYAPYIVTVDAYSEQVLSIYRNWDEKDPSMERLDWIVEFKFIPWRGAYALGLPHLIGGLSAALTGSLRALLDSAHINNAATMLKLRGASRANGQNTQVDITQVCEIEGPAGVDDIRKLAMPMPFNPPSPVLADLMDKLYSLAKGVVATAEEKIGQVGDRTPVGTTMALVEQGSNTYAAIHARLHESQKRVLQILHRLNSQYLDDDEGYEDQISIEDFTGSMDVVPVSDPTIFSEAQRFAQSQAILQMAGGDAQNPNIPWNQIAVRRRMLRQMRIENIDELLPAPKEPISSDLLSENTMIMQGNPLKAQPEQDHLTHIHGHLMFLTSPVQMMNPLVQPQLLMQLLQHIGEHIQMHQTRVTLTFAADHGMSEQGIVAGYQKAMLILQQDLAPVIQTISQVQQQLQQRMPTPPMPPEVQASLEIAKMDTQRKSEYDKATLANQQAKMQAENQLEQNRQAIEQNRVQFEQQLQTAQHQFEQMIETMRLRSEDQAEQLRQQVELMKNEADNHQKQVTDLLKNRDDNDTKMAIAQMQQQLTSMQASMSQVGERQPELGPNLEKLQTMLDQIGRQQTNDALSEIMNGLRETITHLSKPKVTTLVKDAKGETIGARSE